MKEMKKLDNRELNEVMDFARELMVMNGKLEFTPGTKVYVVQKTKKTPGTVRKVLLKNAGFKNFNRKDIVKTERIILNAL